MDVIVQDENSMGPIGSAFSNAQRSAKSYSGRPGVPLGKAALSSKTPGRKAFGNITNVSVQPPRLPEKGLEVKRPRRAFGDITNATPPAQRDVQTAVPMKDPISVPVASVSAEPSARPQQIFDGEREQLAGMSWLELEQQRLSARHGLLDQKEITSVLAPYAARHLPAKDLSIMEWRRRQDRLGRSSLEDVPLCPYVDPPGPDGSESEQFTGDARFRMPALDCSIWCP